MKKNLFQWLLMFAFGTFSAFAQTNPRVAQLPDYEPFKIASGSSFAASVPSAKDTPSKSSVKTDGEVINEDFAAALEIIRQNYVGGKRLDFNKITKSSLTAMLRTLDPHSNYFDSNEYENLLTDQQSEYLGIGASIINYRKSGVFDTYITSVFPDSPAF